MKGLRSDQFKYFPKILREKGLRTFTKLSLASSSAPPSTSPRREHNALPHLYSCLDNSHWSFRTQFVTVVIQPLSWVQLLSTPWTAEHQASLSFTSPEICLNSLHWWCHSTILSSVVHFSSCRQSFPASGSFPMSQFVSGGQSIGASALVLPMNIQDWFPLGLTGLIFLQSKELSRVFSSTIWKHHFFGTKPFYGPTLTSIHD